MSYTNMAMLGRIMVFGGVLIPFFFIQDPRQFSPVNLTFWIITVIGLGLFLFGRINESKERLKKLEAKARKNKIEIEIDEE